MTTPDPHEVARHPQEEALALVQTRAAILVASTGQRALYRTDQASTTVRVDRRSLLRLAEALDAAYPGVVDEIRDSLARQDRS
jgi:hypothetical protein